LISHLLNQYNVAQRCRRWTARYLYDRLLEVCGEHAEIEVDPALVGLFHQPHEALAADRVVRDDFGDHDLRSLRFLFALAACRAPACLAPSPNG